MRERLIKIGIAAIATTALIEISQFAFTRPVRKEVGKRVNWKCEAKGCRKSFWDGWMVEANHIVPEHEGGSQDPSNGNILCLEHHYRFHKDRGDESSARLIYDRIQKTDGGHTREWLRTHRRRERGKIIFNG